MDLNIPEIVTMLPAPHKRPREYLEEGKLASPPLFTSLIPPPRLMLLNSLRPSSSSSSSAGAAAPVPADSGATAPGLASSASSAAAAAAPPPLTRAPNAVALDEYLAWLGNTYYTSAETGMASGQWALLRRTTLGRLTSPVRETSPLDLWAPLEVAKFESAICLVGKQFPLISKVIGTKTASEVIEFYYLWKQSKNYKIWKEGL